MTQVRISSAVSGGLPRSRSLRHEWFNVCLHPPGLFTLNELDVLDDVSMDFGPSGDLDRVLEQSHPAQPWYSKERGIPWSRCSLHITTNDEWEQFPVRAHV